VADPLCHATQGSLMALAPFISRIRKKTWLWTLVLAGAILGELPDLAGVYGTLVEHDFGQRYESAHTGPIRDVLQYIPMSALHLYLDSLKLEMNKHWNVWIAWICMEAVLWLMNILLIIWFTKIWKRTAAGGTSPEGVRG
jgi:hypothetical protein